VTDKQTDIMPSHSPCSTDDRQNNTTNKFLNRTRVAVAPKNV